MGWGYGAGAVVREVYRAVAGWPRAPGVDLSFDAPPPLAGCPLHA